MPGGLDTAQPSVSVIIPCRNEAKCIARCLQSVLKQASPPGGFEVLVADGASDDGTREIVHQIALGNEPEPQNHTRPDGGAILRPPVREIGNEGRTVSRGLNAAIKAARGDVIIRMDAHTDYAPDYIQQCVATLKQTQADNVGGPARTRAEGYLGKAIAAAYHSPFAVGGARFHDDNYEGWVDTVTYGCWPKQTFQRFGYFDEELARNQDDEHNLRIIRGGGRVWQNPRIISWYHPRASLALLFRQYLQYGYWKVRVIRKHKLPASVRHLVPGAFVLVLVSSLLSLGLGWLLQAVSDAPALVYEVPAAVLAFVLGAYVLCSLVASLITAKKDGWALLPVLPAVFATYHFSYGCGFLCGIVGFMGRKSMPHARFEVLTR